MSRIKDLHRALSSSKKLNLDREDIKYMAQRDGEGNIEIHSSHDIVKCDPIDHHLGIVNSFLIDNNLLKPLKFKIDRIVLIYSALFLWALLILANDSRIRWLLFGCFLSILGMGGWILWLHIHAQSQIEYRKDLLDYYSNELDCMIKMKEIDSFRFESCSSKRKGWVYVTEKYDKTTFKSSDLVLAYASLQNGILTLYIIDEKCILKHRLPLDGFNNLLKKMYSSQKFALDVSELEITLVPDDLTMGRMWNKKFPIKLTATRDVLGVLDVEAPVTSFVDFFGACSEPFVIPSYHRTTPLRLYGSTIYLFGVCSREKERWYYKLLANRDNYPSPDLTECARNSERANFHAYIGDAVSKGKYVGEKIKRCFRDDSQTVCPATSLMSVSMFTLNVIFSRLFWDLWREQTWNERILSRIQRSLDRLVLPQWLKCLRAENLNIGDTLPLLFSAEAPIMDEDGGFWVNCPIQYHGKFSVTIHSQIHHDLYGIYIEKGETESSDILKESQKHTEETESIIEYESELVQTNVGSNFSVSSDPEVRIVGEIPHFEKKGASRIKNNMVKMLQGNKEALKVKVTDYAKKICKSAVTRIENSSHSLLLKLTSLKGTLSIYFPPPPSNRIWLGFRNMPAIDFEIKPKIGTRVSLKIPVITQLIEKKLKDEFRDVFVMPSMVDLYLPFLSSGLSFPFNNLD